ncbi:hypothetical protein TNCT_639531 [Trichonephila clavata]|uniref:Uncharacterized protein n=1 Tax=Trichonephila clavata TaxID=2740835 RepID=A0A8X6F5R2_TRICU|nr:hypothetical protein TNCT_639531 [Trichonephila clavata]
MSTAHDLSHNSTSGPRGLPGVAGNAITATVTAGGIFSLPHVIKLWGLCKRGRVLRKRMYHGACQISFNTTKETASNRVILRFTTA